MHAPPRIRGGLTLRLDVLLFGLLVFAAGIALLESGLGLSPWGILHRGIARHTALSFGEANIAVSTIVVAAAWVLGATIGIGTIANALGVVSGGTIGVVSLAFAVAIGRSVEVAFWTLGRTPLVERTRKEPARTPGRTLLHDQQGGLTHV